MALKNVKRVTFSLPKLVIKKMELSIPKNKRSKFVADSILKNIAEKGGHAATLEETHQFWRNFRKQYPVKLEKSVEQIIREDRMSH